jgi:hypothetical protein
MFPYYDSKVPIFALHKKPLKRIYKYASLLPNKVYMLIVSKHCGATTYGE